MINDALARVKAARALYIPKPQLADGFYLNADIDALVREVEAGRKLFGPVDDFFSSVHEDLARQWMGDTYDQIVASLDACDAARKGTPDAERP